MKIITEPSVYMIGRQIVDTDQLNQFLSDNAITWESDSEIGAEVLSEVAGRTCYLSFAKPRPGGNAAYLGHIKETGHGSVLEHAVWTFMITGVSRSLTHELVRHRAGFGYCLAGDTLIYSEHMQNGLRQGATKRTIRSIYEKTLTPHGRSRLKLMRLRCLDGSVFTTTVIKGVVESGVKDIYKVTLRSGKSVRCSIDHRFLTADGWKPVRDISVGEPLATNGLPSAGLQREWLRERYHERGMMLVDIAEEAGCSVHTVAKWVGRYGLRKPVGVGMIGRRPWNTGITYTTGWHHTEETKKLLSEQKRGAKNPCWQGDYAKPNAGRMRAQKLFPTEPCVACGTAEGHRHHLDRNPLNNDRSNIQFLCASCHQMLHIEEDGPQHLLRVKWDAVASIAPDGREMTYDIEVGHPCHNFVANGFVTHNSQLSQRYVDESVAEYVEPNIIAADPELHEIWLEAVGHAHRAYVKLADKLNEKLKPTTCQKCNGNSLIGGWPCQACDGYGLRYSMFVPRDADATTRRKAARQAARSVLPNATETKITITGNARAFRHFLEQRGSVFADPEIRKLANKVLDILQAEAPNLFGDYTWRPLPDGVPAIETPYRKV